MLASDVVPLNDVRKGTVRGTGGAKAFDDDDFDNDETDDDVEDDNGDVGVDARGKQKTSGRERWVNEGCVGSQVERKSAHAVDDSPVEENETNWERTRVSSL